MIITKLYNMKTMLLRLFIFIATFSLCYGCSKDADMRDLGNHNQTNGDMMVTFKLKVPGVNNPNTRAISEADESHISEIDVLVFKVSGATETYLYRTHATDIDNNSGLTNKQFKAVLRKSTGTERHRIVVITNLRNEIENIASSFTSTMTKAEVLDLIQFESLKWNTTNSSDFTPLPMWGEAASAHIVTETTNSTTLGEIQLLRAVARLDVGLKMNTLGVPQGLGDTFKISDINIYSTMKKGYAVPDVGNFETTTKVSAPTLPSNWNDPSAGWLNSSPLSYNYSTPVIGSVREIYLAESENSDPLIDPNNVTCIVLGGYYTAPNATVNTSTKSWYRIDFYDRSSNVPANTRLDILRNHRYRVNITTVDGPGYESESEARESAPINMEAEVIAWDETGMNDVTSDGQYQLTVDKDSIYLYSEGRAVSMRIYTDVPNGWKIKDEDKPDWVVLSQNEAATGGFVSEITISASAWSIPNAPREGYITITAGRMKKKIKVYQSTNMELWIDVQPLNLVFYKTATNPKTIQVRSYPTSAYRIFRTHGNVQWALGYHPDYDLSYTSFETYSIKPDVNTSGQTLVSSIDVSVTNGYSGQEETKTISVRQLDYDPLFRVNSSSPFNRYGGNFYLNVMSQLPWKLAKQDGSDPQDFLTLSDLTEQPGTQGNYASFPITLSANPNYATRTATIKATSSDPDFEEQSIVVTQLGDTPLLTAPTVFFGDRTSYNLNNPNYYYQYNYTINTNADFTITAEGAAIDTMFYKVFYDGGDIALDGSTVITGGTPGNSVAVGIAVQFYHFNPLYDSDFDYGYRHLGKLKFETVNIEDATPCVFSVNVSRVFGNPTGELALHCADGTIVYSGHDPNLAMHVASSVSQIVTLKGMTNGESRMILSELSYPDYQIINTVYEDLPITRINPPGYKPFEVSFLMPENTTTSKKLYRISIMRANGLESFTFFQNPQGS